MNTPKPIKASEKHELLTTLRDSRGYQAFIDLLTADRDQLAKSVLEDDSLNCEQREAKRQRYLELKRVTEKSLTTAISNLEKMTGE